MQSEFFSSDNIYIGAITIAALAAAMSFFVNHLEKEIEQTKKEIEQTNTNNLPPEKAG